MSLPARKELSEANMKVDESPAPDGENLAEAYRYCESVTRKHAKSFYFAARFLPRHKQPSVFAIYAFCRHVDDEIDESGLSDEVQAARAVEEWKSRLSEVYSAVDSESEGRREPGSEPIDKVFLAWKDMLPRYPIDREIPLDLIRGVTMDTYKKRYDTFEELYVYCYRVASTVGLMSSEILGYSNREALKYAEALGIGMQLTNILRDVREDAERGRIYLPKEDLERFGVTEDEIFGSVFSDRFRALMEFEIERARHYYSEGEKGIAYLDRDTRFTVLFASRIYARILDEIEALSHNVFSSRAHTSKTQKILALPGVWREARKITSV